MTEMIFALGLLMVLSACFYATMNTIQKMDKSFTDESCGLMVVDNTIERLEHKKQYNSDDVKRIFLDEYDKSGIKDRTKMIAGFTPDNDGAAVAIIKKNGKTLIEVQIKCRQ
jgi:hypothetical protein